MHLPDLNNIASSDFSTEENTMQAQADNMRSNAQVEKRTPANKPECEAGDRQTTLNPLLCYITYGLNSGTPSHVKSTVLGTFTSHEITSAKNILFNQCDTDIIGENIKRQSTNTRSKEEANIHDIVQAIIQLDNSQKLPTMAIAAFDLHKIPRMHPEETNMISALERIRSLEDTVNNLRYMVDTVMTDNASLRADITSHCAPSYAKIASGSSKPNTLSKSPLSNPSIVSSQTGALNTNSTTKIATPNIGNVSSKVSTNKIPDRNDSKGNTEHIEPNNTNNKSAKKPDTKVPDTAVPAEEVLDSDVPSDITPELSSRTSDDGQEGFMQPRYHRRKQSRRIVRGNRSDDRIQGAPVASRFLFIYRVKKTTSVDNINTYLMDMEVDVRSLESVSHKDAKYKSFKLEVSKDDYTKLFSEDAWPNGICVKQYISKRKAIDSSEIPNPRQT